MDGVGFTAKLKMTGIPLVMPPLMPPLRLVSVTTRPSCIRKGSFACEPRRDARPKPSPNSMPLTPPTANAARASTPSSESNQGSPSPAGRPQMPV